MSDLLFFDFYFRLGSLGMNFGEFFLIVFKNLIKKAKEPIFFNFQKMGFFEIRKIGLNNA